MRITQEWPNRKLLGVTARADTIERYFKTTLVQYSDETGLHYANATPPSVPARLASVVLAVSGLSDSVHAPPTLDRPDARNGVSSAQTGYSIAQIERVYDEPISENGAYDGTGTTIAIEAFGKYLASDIEAFYTEMGISRPLPRVVLVDKKLGTLARSQEATADVDWASGIAPGANVTVYEGPVFSDKVAEDVYSAVVNDPTVDVTTTSWGGCEALDGADFLSTADDLFQQGSAEGITQFGPAGDNGSNDCRGNFGSKPPKTYPNPSVDFPASDPEMGAGGGTELTIAANGKRESEIGWPLGVPSAIWGGGGGASTYFPVPSYQAGIVALANAGILSLASTSYRNTPDIAIMGAPIPQGYTICYGGCFGGNFGTSFAGPNLAGIYAQIDSYTQHRMGRAATGLYAWSLKREPVYPTAVYYDITSGSNGLYTAAANYDNVTGFGSFKSANQYMLKLPVPSGAQNL
jgi:kumamolisin